MTARGRKEASPNPIKQMKFDAIAESVKAQLSSAPIQHNQHYLPQQFIDSHPCPTSTLLDMSTATSFNPQIYNSLNIAHHHSIYEAPLGCFPANVSYCEPVHQSCGLCATSCAPIGQFIHPPLDVMTMSLPDPNAFHLMSPPSIVDPSTLQCIDESVAKQKRSGYNELFPHEVSDTLKAMKMSMPASSLKALPSQIDGNKALHRSHSSAARVSRQERWQKTQSTISHDQISDDDEGDPEDAFPLFEESPVVRRKSRTRIAEDFRTHSLCLPQSHLDHSTFSLDISRIPSKETGTLKKHQRSRERRYKDISLDSTTEIRKSNNVIDSSSSIKAIIDDVRAVLLGDIPVHQQSYLSDEADEEVAKTNSRSIENDVNRLKTTQKDSIEGTTHTVKRNNSFVVGEIDPKLKQKSYSPTDKSEKLTHKTQKLEMFTKCRSFSNSTVSDAGDESGSDEVFVKSPKRNARYTKRRSSSLDALDSIAPFQKLNPKSDQNRNSTVSINNKLEYFEYRRSPVSPAFTDGALRLSASSSPANSASLFPNAPSHGVALLRTRPKRGSLKKSSNKSLDTTTNINKTNVHDVTSTRSNQNSSEYDVRDRGRGRNSGRDAYNRHRGGGSGGGGSDREADRLSDRDQGSFNRSLSNAEGTMDDKIGE